MSWVDVAIILGSSGSTAFGASRGFAKAALSLVIWLAAIWIAWRFTWLIEPMLGEWVVAPDLKVWVARALIFVLVLAVGGLIARLVGRIIKHTGLSGVNRILGSRFGMGRGAIEVGLMLNG